MKTICLIIMGLLTSSPAFAYLQATCTSVAGTPPLQVVLNLAPSSLPGEPPAWTIYKNGTKFVSLDNPKVETNGGRFTLTAQTTRGSRRFPSLWVTYDFDLNSCSLSGTTMGKLYYYLASLRGRNLIAVLNCRCSNQ